MKTPFRIVRNGLVVGFFIALVMAACESPDLPYEKRSLYEVDYLYDQATGLCFAGVSPRSTYKGGTVFIVECTDAVLAKAGRTGDR